MTMTFEEFTLGQRYVLDEVTIQPDKLEAFAREYDPLPLHLDEEYAKTTGFGALIAPGVMSFMTVWAQFARINVWGASLIAGRNVFIEWLAPVYAGDKLSGVATVTGLTRRNARNGMVQVTLEIANQNGVAVIKAVNEAVVAAKGPGEATPLLGGVDRESRARFLLAKEQVLAGKRGKKGIGTLSEKTLHAVIKRYMEPYEGNHETKIGAYVADIVGEDGIIEIQTRSLSRMRKKLETFLDVAHVTVVYPIAHSKWVCWVDPATGETSAKRRSPKTGSFYHAFGELYGIRQLLTHPNLTIRLLLVDMEEYRHLDGWNKTKKRGSSRYERIPLALHDELEVGGDKGFAALIPEGLPEHFTSRDFAHVAGLHLSEAQTALNVLHAIGVLERCGKRERMNVYKAKNK
jgi:acyl dehydratase